MILRAVRDFWSASSARSGKRLNDIAAAHYATADQTRKPKEYFEIYAAMLGKFVGKRIKMLELGVFSGASLAIWHEYFRRGSIVGLDLSPVPDKLKDLVATGHIQFVRGDQSDPAVLDQAIRLTGGDGFDVIIDDASHVGILSKASFHYLFRNGLKPGGYYFIEDYGTGYMRGFPDGAPYVEPAGGELNMFPSHHFGMVGWMKQLVDETNRGEFTPDHRPYYPIASLTFWPSIALVRKTGS